MKIVSGRRKKYRFLLNGVVGEIGHLLEVLPTPHVGEAQVYGRLKRRLPAPSAEEALKNDFYRVGLDFRRAAEKTWTPFGYEVARDVEPKESEEESVSSEGIRPLLANFENARRRSLGRT